MTRKPFDLEAAIAGAAIETRDGTPVKFIAYVPEAEPDQRVVAFTDNCIRTFYESGSYSEADFLLDIYMKPKKKTYWLNVYRYDNGHPWVGSLLFADKDSAVNASRNGATYIATIDIEVDE